MVTEKLVGKIYKTTLVMSPKAYGFRLPHPVEGTRSQAKRGQLGNAELKHWFRKHLSVPAARTQRFERQDSLAFGQ